MRSQILKTRMAIVLAAIVCGLIAAFVARQMRVPVEAGFSASLLQPPTNPVIALLVVAVTIIALTAVVSMALGRLRPEAGLFCAAVALAAFSLRGGSISTTFRHADGPSILLLLSLELVLLYAIVGAAIYVSNLVAPPPPPAPTDEAPLPLNHHLLAVAVQTVTMTIVMLILAQSESKKQAVAAVLVASYLGAIAAHYTFPVRNGLWLALAPLPVGLVGYFLEYSKPSLLPIGMASQPLATALPLDYVAAGIVGGILGHWMSQKWQAESQADAAPTAAAAV